MKRVKNKKFAKMYDYWSDHQSGETLEELPDLRLIQLTSIIILDKDKDN